MEERSASRSVLWESGLTLVCYGKIPSSRKGAASKMSEVGALTRNTARWSSLVARWAHNPKVVGSNPALATNIKALCMKMPGLS